jgi:C4-dicarboxylate transporter
LIVQNLNRLAWCLAASGLLLLTIATELGDEMLAVVQNSAGAIGFDINDAPFTSRVLHAEF